MTTKHNILINDLCITQRNQSLNFISWKMSKLQGRPVGAVVSALDLLTVNCLSDHGSKIQHCFLETFPSLFSTGWFQEQT